MPGTGCPYNRRILVIDDNEGILEDFKRILNGGKISDDLTETEHVLFGSKSEEVNSPKGFEVECVRQGQLGLALVEKAMEQNLPFAMAFVDMRMPTGWDGVETIEQLWKVAPDLLVVMCTAYSDHQWEHMTQRLGHSEKLVILRKPFDMIEVQQLADSLTHMWNLSRQANDQMTSLVEAETALQKALAETEGLVKSIASILIGLDDHNQVFRWNDTAQKTFGLAGSLVLEQSFTAIPVQWDWDQILSAIEDCRRSHQAVRIPELFFVNHSKDEGILEMMVNPIVSDDDVCCGVLVLGNDITEQKVLETQIAFNQKMESIGQLAAGVAHEINTPVHYVTENLRFLKESFQEVHRVLDSYETFLDTYQFKDGDEARVKIMKALMKEVDLEYLRGEIPVVLDQTIEGTDRVTEIVCAMKELSHPGTGEKVTANINHAVKSAITLATSEWKEYADIITNFDPELPLIPCFVSELQQVMVNLIINAAHAIEETQRLGVLKKGTITVSTRQDNDWVEIRLSDTGMGIKPSIQGKVFDPFFTTKEVGKGTGQGLASAHTIIVQKHEGSLRFESEEGQGTTFIIRLPLCLVEANSGIA